MGQLGDRVAEALVEITGGDVAAMDVRKHVAGRYGGERAGHRFDPIAQNDDQVCGLIAEEIGDTAYAPSEAAGLIERIIVAFLHGNSRGDAPAVPLDLADGASKFRQQVHAGYDEVEGEPWMCVDRVQRGAEDAVFRARTRNDDDSATTAGWWARHRSMSHDSMVSRGMGARAMRPTTSSSRRAGMPVPGRFSVTMLRSMESPAEMSVAVTMLLVASCRTSA
jgi:hypothetical protein